MHTKHRTLFTGVAIVAVFLFAYGAVSAEQVTLHHFIDSSHGVAFREFIEKKAEDFQQLHPNVTIEIELGPGSSSYMEQVIVREAAGVAPDVYDMNENWGGVVVDDDIFLDLRPYFEKEPGLMDEIVSIALDGFTWIDGTIWSFPIDVYPNVTVFNKTMLDELGLISPDALGDDWTWDIFLQYSQRITRDVTGDGEFDRWSMERLARLWTKRIPLRQAGGGFVNSTINPTEVIFTKPETVVGAEFLANLARDGHWGPSGSFSRGETAYAYAGPSWVWDRIVRGTLGDFEWGIARPMHGPDNNGTLNALIGFQISKRTEHPDLAWEWVRFLAGTHESQMEYAATTGRVPTLRSAIMEYSDATDFPSAVSAELLHAITHPASYHNIVGGVVDVRTEAGEFNVRVMDDGENPAIVLDELQQRIQGMIDQELEKQGNT